MSQHAHVRTRPGLVAVATIALFVGCHDSPTQPVPDAVAVTPNATLVQVGDSVALTASYQFGAASQPADGRVRWTSSDTSVFTVDRAGYGHALKYTGAPITVTATTGGVSGSADIEVLPKFDSLIVTVSATLAAGRTVHPAFAIVVPIVSSAFNRFQELPELARDVELTSSDPATVSVESDGSLRAVAPGHTTITAELAGKRSTVPVDVVNGYAVTSLPGTEAYTVKGVNDAGAIIASRAGGADVLWQSGSASDLGACSARDINNAGQIACVVAAGRGFPGVYSNGTLTVLFDSSAYYSGESTGISEAGTVFGLVSNAVGSPALFLAASGGITIPAFGERGWYGDAYAINSLNHAVVVDRASYARSSIIGGASPIDLWALNGRFAEARDLNDADDAVGSSERMGGGGSGTVWRAATNWKPESPSYRAGKALGISEAGLVIGNGADGPYVWKAGRYTILNDALATKEWTLTSVAAISRSGIVAAQATSSTGAKSVVLIDLGALQ